MHQIRRGSILVHDLGLCVAFHPVTQCTADSDGPLQQAYSCEAPPDPLDSLHVVVLVLPPSKLTSPHCQSREWMGLEQMLEYRMEPGPPRRKLPHPEHGLC